MKILTIIFQAIAPGFLIVGLGIIAIYSIISVKNHAFEWFMVLIGAVLFGLGLLMVTYVQRREHVNWLDALLGMLWWT